MGIRYYAYAFDADQTEQALAHPDAILSADPLADAWGLVDPGAMCSAMTGVQAVPLRDMLYLDKVWRHLQQATAPMGDSIARPAYRMFEGDVSWTDRGHLSWVRPLVPDEVPEIAQDLMTIGRGELGARLRTPMFGQDLGQEIDDVVEYLERARTFMSTLAADGRGMVYTIG